MGHHYQRKLDAAHVRKRRPQATETDGWRGMETNTVMQLQRTIGNQAVQRLISSDKQRNDANTVIQRAPNDQPKDKETSLPPWVAKMVFERAGELKGKSRIAGHEGKVEVLSLSFGELHRPSNRRREDREAPSPPLFGITITRNIDDLSPIFARAGTDGDPIKTAQFELIRRDDDGEVTTVQTFEFGDGLITSYQLSSGADGQVEVMQLEFQTGPS